MKDFSTKYTKNGSIWLTWWV